MMRACYDKASGLWKWGNNGKPMYVSKEECEREEMKIFINRLEYVRNYVSINGRP